MKLLLFGSLAGILFGFVLSFDSVNYPQCSGSNCAVSSQYVGYSSSSRSVVSPTIQCPADFVNFHGQCVRSTVTSQTAVDQTSCPPGFYLTIDNMCERSTRSTDIKQPSYECPPGAVLEGQFCRFNDTAINVTVPGPQLPQCPVGYTFDGHSCVQPQPICPTGYRFHSGMCWPIGPSAPVIEQPVYQPCGQSCQSNVPCAASYNCMRPVNVPVSPPIHPQYPPQYRPVQPPISPPVIIPRFPPVPASPVCPNGYIWTGVSCIKEDTDVERVPPKKDCPWGFTRDSAGDCVKNITSTVTTSGTPVCAEGFNLIGGMCQQVVITPQPLPVPCTNNCPIIQQPQQPIEATHERNITVTTNNHNPVNVTTNINSFNNHSITLHLGSQSSNSKCREEEGDGGVKVIRCESPKSEPIVLDQATEKVEPKCCEVVSPRICTKRANDDWYCHHKRTEKCGSFCSAPRIYLRPPRPVYQPMQMVMMPQPVQYQPRMRPVMVQHYRQSHGTFC